MFDSVGKTIDPDAGRRRVYSASLTLLLLGTTVGGGFAYVAWQAARIVYQEIVPDDDMVEIEMVEEQPEELEAPPPPPMQQAGGLADEPEPDEPPPTPVAEEMQEEVEQLDEHVEEKVSSQAGNPDADPNAMGTADGDPNGKPDGVRDGTGTGPRVFHHSEVTIKRQVTPVYPEEAKDLNMGDVTCRVRIFIDTEGVPYDIVFESCPKPFHQSATEALQKWRWYPARMGGEKVAAQFVMVFKYTLK